MSGLMMGPEATERFNAICKRLSDRGQALSFIQLRDAATLAREVEAGKPASKQARLAIKRLGLPDGDLDAE